MITFGRKLKHLRQKNHLTQKELGMAVGFPDSCADVRIAQYESDVRTPKEDLMKLFASTLGVPVELFTVPVLSWFTVYVKNLESCFIEHFYIFPNDVSITFYSVPFKHFDNFSDGRYMVYLPQNSYISYFCN